MKIRSMLLLSLLALTVAYTPANSALARGKKPVLEPGKYKAWGDDIDEIEIVKTFKAADFDKVAVEKFDTSATPTPKESEKSYESTRAVLNSYTDTLAEALRDELKAKKVEQAAKSPKEARTLIVRGRVDEVEPGSRAGRMLAGYGAGSAATKVTGEIVDAANGSVLARFTQKRRSGGTFKFAGGNDVQVMRDSIHAVAQDIAHIIEAFQ